ncbi:2-amino-4-hydroxy-6-hydroxymethyldihydropteridine diphosphokinase [Sphingomonas aurantiaca]|jgi:2-amino-4-hydroxy-6-hydroxymethyldihydropteridine diphosphokinase|uniref:2-amino-4-hydroxy-6-hydroxymethyldihydropteridine pyrophosphokinase n=1 Tax=Sphingomonas aurantiaca TaxID=185949 RepID=A0A2T5GLC9_9SPHN|nr:2-amino-4-hydroxy-6-hydroxymethyldihydropteridine diphosphokinase [Sphingomonas aurantiaca]PTQ60133.1 2-amino-4-hydroxy-6-hydroxymethyldihydropteridine diphosphokinase [Sphingomonas aurantiaca]
MSPATPLPPIARPASTYVIALGSNRRGRHGAPEREIAAALAMLGDVVARSPTVASAPLGPSNRRYANAVALIETSEDPAALLVRLKQIERRFGRRAGRRWGSRVIDLDIILWSGGAWTSPGLVVPHAAYRTRGFVLAPLAGLVPAWRDPRTGRTIRQLAQLVDRRRPRD